MALIEVERAILCVCFKDEVPEGLLAELGDRRSWLAYRELVRDRLRKELSVALPRTRRVLGDVAIEAAFRRQLDQTPPRSRFFRDVVLELVKSALHTWRADYELAPWGADLAAYEAAIWEVSDIDARTPEPREFGFERAPLLSPALRLLTLAYPVHQGADSAGRYAQGEHFLGVYRAADDERPRTWTMNRSTHSLLTMWQSDPQLTVSEAVRALSRLRGFVVDEAFIDGLCGVLAEFLDAGILLGSR